VPVGSTGEEAARAFEVEADEPPDTDAPVAKAVPLEEPPVMPAVQYADCEAVAGGAPVSEGQFW
jgi:hypothetical protein